MKNLKNKGGITLIALVITIIVLMILSGVAISLIAGDKSVIQGAQEASSEYEEALSSEVNVLENVNYQINKVNAEIKINITDIKCREFIINANIEDITEEITEVEYFVNGNSVARVAEKSYKVEELEPETEYNVYVKMYNKNGKYYESDKITAKTADKVYLVKDGKAIMNLEIFESTIDYTYDDRIRVKTSNIKGRGGIGHIEGIDLSQYKNLCLDAELISTTFIDSRAAVVLWLFNMESSHIEGVAITNKVLYLKEALKRNIYKLNIEEINQQVKITICKNMTNPEGEAVFDIYNLWLEI